MKNKLNLVLNEVLREINPNEDELEFMKNSLSNFLVNTKERIKKLKIEAEIFVGGSYAKKTLIRGEFYDIDLFLRFGKQYSEKEYKSLSEKILKGTKNLSTIHGSRDYFRANIGKSVFFEIVPVKKIKSSKEAVNITDLSYSHVNYIAKKVKSKRVLDGIKLAKAFLKSSKIYGAESYVNGFSGYSLELLIYHFGSFENFLKKLIAEKKEKLIIDIEKLYKKENVLLDMNGSKLDSPIILVDPTYKARNVLAALSQETYERFKGSAKNFLKNPTVDFFKEKKLDFSKIKDEAEKRKFEFLSVDIKTKKEAGDIAGTKLLKFFNHLSKEMENSFEIKKKDFEYHKNKSGRGYFILKQKKERIFQGPSIKDEKNSLKFKKEHNKIFEKKGRFYASEKIDLSGKEFLQKWVKKNKRKVKEMYISGIEFYS